MERLPADDPDARSNGQASTSGASDQPTYLLVFPHRLLDFRIPELESVAELAGCKPGELKLLEPFGGEPLAPYWYMTVPSEDIAKKIAARAVLLKVIIELWGEGPDMASLRSAVEACPSPRTSPYRNVSFKIIVDGYGKSYTMKEQVDTIEQLSWLPLLGKIDLRTPQHKFWLLRAETANNNGVPSMPDRLYFGREVALGQRQLVDQYALKRRLYIGPTSMDAELSLVMANIAKVAKGHIVMDPYVGTGSVLVACAHFGAHTLGSDIDFKVIRGIGKVGPQGQQLSLWSNFTQYGLEHPVGLLRMDVHNPPFRSNLEGWLGAIIGDPPYGVRAGAKKVVFVPDALITNPSTHFPRTQPYTLGEVLRDLLDLGARTLHVGGRLVYWMPASPETYSEEELPGHPMMERVYNCEQILTTRYSRRLIVMQKVKPYDKAAAEAYHEAMGPPMMAIDQIHDLVYEKIKDERGKVVVPERYHEAPKFRGKSV